jgi:hypothetical protein
MTSFSLAQASPSASRHAEAQVGIGYVIAYPDYGNNYLNGIAVYADLDFRNHLGTEFEYHHIGGGDNLAGETESSYELGVRYSRHYGKFQPYGKFMVGGGVFDHHLAGKDGQYKLYAFGGGTDFRILRSVNLRMEFEQQEWFRFQPHGLSPNFVTIGFAYHFQ